MSIKRRAHFALLFLFSLIYNLIFMSKSIIFVQYVGDSTAAAWWVVIWTVTQLCLSNNTHHNNINIHNHMVWICTLIPFYRCKTLVHIINHRWTQIIGYSIVCLQSEREGHFVVLKQNGLKVLCISKKDNNLWSNSWVTLTFSCKQFCISKIWLWDPSAATFTPLCTIKW